MPRRAVGGCFCRKSKAKSKLLSCHSTVERRLGGSARESIYPRREGQCEKAALAFFGHRNLPATGAIEAGSIARLLTGDLEAAGHEEEVTLKTRTQHDKIRPRLPDSRTRKNRRFEQSHRPFRARRGNRHAIEEFVDWYCSEPRLALNRTVVLCYRSHLESRQLAPGTINLRLGAVRRLACEAAECGLLSAVSVVPLREEQCRFFGKAIAS